MQHIDNIKKLFDKNFVENPLIESFDAGELYLSSGKIVACDPLITNDKESFEVQFPIGKFPILIHKEKESHCIAYVEVIFSQNKISRWELATCNGQKIETLEDGEVFGYPVQSGMGCLMDSDTQNLLNDLEQILFKRKGADFMGIYEEFFHSHFFDENGAIDQFALLTPNDKKPNNLIAFETGYGEGFYTSYIGFDEENQPVKIVSEFIEIE